MTRDDYLHGWHTIARKWNLPGQDRLAEGLWNDDGFWLEKLPTSALTDSIAELEQEHEPGRHPRPVDLHKKLRRYSTPPPRRGDPADDAALGRRSLDPRAYPLSPRARPLLLDRAGNIDHELTAAWRHRYNR